VETVERSLILVTGRGRVCLGNGQVTAPTTNLTVTDDWNRARLALGMHSLATVPDRLVQIGPYGLLVSGACIWETGLMASAIGALLKDMPVR